MLDTLIYNGTKYRLPESPLYPILAKLRYNPFYSPRTICNRGFIAHWEIKDSKLFLIKFKGFTRRKTKVGIEYLFPNKTEVFAKWFSEILFVYDIEENRNLEGNESIKNKVFHLGFYNGVLFIFKDSNKESDELDKEPDLPF